jgi:hypothetical protein
MRTQKPWSKIQQIYTESGNMKAVYCMDGKVWPEPEDKVIDGKLYLVFGKYYKKLLNIKSIMVKRVELFEYNQPEMAA